VVDIHAGRGIIPADCTGFAPGSLTALATRRGLFAFWGVVVVPLICELLDSPTLQALAAEIDAILDEPDAEPVTVPAEYRAQLASDIPDCNPVAMTKAEREAEWRRADTERLMRNRDPGLLGSEV
jgi:hypothetical protein